MIIAYWNKSDCSFLILLWPVQFISLFTQFILTPLFPFITIRCYVRFKQCLRVFIFICHCYSKTQYIVCIRVHHTRNPNSAYQQLSVYLVWRHNTLPSPTPFVTWAWIPLFEGDVIHGRPQRVWGSAVNCNPPPPQCVWKIFIGAFRTKILSLSSVSLMAEETNDTFGALSIMNSGVPGHLVRATNVLSTFRRPRHRSLRLTSARLSLTNSWWTKSRSNTTYKHEEFVLSTR